MSVFFAWSGVRSYKLASAFAACIGALSSAEPFRYFISSEIAPGTRWLDAVERAIDEADAIVVFLTPDNLRSPWAHFEAGAVSRKARDSVYLYLVGVRPSDVGSPLGAYQGTEVTEEATRRLFARLHPTANLDAGFAAAWAGLQREIRTLAVMPISELIPKFAALFQRKTFQEPLEECMDQNWLDRYFGARQTLERLQSELKSAGIGWQAYQLALLQELINELDGYVREMRKLLVREVQFPAHAGLLDLTKPQPVSTDAVEGAVFWNRRRQRILQLALDLQDPGGGPLLDDALFFFSLQPFAQRKVFVHRKELEIEAGTFHLERDTARLCAASRWEFDRIALYLAQEHNALGEPIAFDAGKLARQVEAELETLQAHDPAIPSLMPLHYALRALCRSIEKAGAGTEAARVVDCVAQTRAFLDQHRLDGGGQMNRRLEALERLMARS